MTFIHEVTRAYCHPLRQEILDVISEGRGRLGVCEIAVQIGEKQSNTSQHLGIMKKAGLLYVEPDRNDPRKYLYKKNYALLKVLEEFQMNLDDYEEEHELQLLKTG